MYARKARSYSADIPSAVYANIAADTCAYHADNMTDKAIVSELSDMVWWLQHADASRAEARRLHNLLPASIRAELANTDALRFATVAYEMQRINRAMRRKEYDICAVMR